MWSPSTVGGESAPRYSNTLTAAGDWENPPRFREVLREARNTPLTPRETVDFFRVQDKLRAGMAPEFRDQIEATSAQARPLLHRESAEQYATMRLASQVFPQHTSRATAHEHGTARQESTGAQLDEERRPDLER